VSSGTTNTDKESMTSLEVNDSVDLGHMGDGILEED
tara:strand:- start:660 stop:767 length:108 start_codon:yes stop_codon:yes gene_type:complete